MSLHCDTRGAHGLFRHASVSVQEGSLDHTPLAVHETILLSEVEYPALQLIEQDDEYVVPVHAADALPIDAAPQSFTVHVMSPVHCTLVPHVYR